jgi:hypothetical protein
VNQLARRRAVDAWMIGAALNLAKKKQKEDKNFVAWLQANVPLSRATAYRWMRLSRRLTLEECENRPLQYVYDVIDHQIAEQEGAKTLAETSATIDPPSQNPQSTDLETVTPEPATDGSEADSESATEKKSMTTKPVTQKPSLSWSVADEPEIEIEETLEKFQRSVENLVVNELSKQQRMVLKVNLTNLKSKVDAVILTLAA